MMERAMAKEKKPAQSIEIYLKQIEEVVEKLESGEIDLEEAIKNYEKGMALIEKCREILKHSKLRVEMLKRKAAVSGEPADDAPSGVNDENNNEADGKSEKSNENKKLF
jgi:exodeoxyribonuclease VII small subunit